MKKMLKMSLLNGFSQKNGQNDRTPVKLFIMTVKSLLEVKVNLEVSKYNPV